MKFKKIILISFLLLIFLSVGAVNATDSNNGDDLVADENYDLLGDAVDSNDLSNSNCVASAIDENNSKAIDSDNGEDLVADETDNLLGDAVDNDNLSISNYDDSVNENNSKNKEILSSANGYSIKETSDSEVYLVKPVNGDEFYILDSFSTFINSKIKFTIYVLPYIGNTYGGTVTLKFNGNYYTADIFDGEATIIAKAPSKAGSYKAFLMYGGYTYIFGSNGYKYNPSYSTFILNVKKESISVKAPAVTAYYKDNKYFKVGVKKNGKPVKNLKIYLKVYTGKKAKTYTVRTNSNGVASLKTSKFSVGTHNVVISSTNKNYKFTKTSKIIIKKKPVSNYKTIVTSAKYYWITKKSGAFTVKTIIWDMTAGFRAPYKYIDTFLYKNGKQVRNEKYYVNYQINGKWTGWAQYGIISTAHHRYMVYDSDSVGQILVKFNKNVNSFI